MSILMVVVKGYSEPKMGISRGNTESNALPHRHLQSIQEKA